MCLRGLLGRQLGKVQKKMDIVMSCQGSGHYPIGERSPLMDFKLEDDAIIFLLRTDDLGVGEEIGNMTEYSGMKRH